MPFFSINSSFDLHYLDIYPAGKETVLLLHGLGVNAQSWQMQFPALTRAGFRVLAPDARGFGKSGYPGGSTSIAEMASDFKALLDYLEIEHAHVAGISMGGTHALQMALDFPQCVKKLVLINTFARLRPKDWKGWAYFAARFFLVHFVSLEAQAHLVAKHLFPGERQEELRQQLIEQVKNADPRGYRAVMRALASFNATSELDKIQLPTIVITGECDRTVPPERQQILAERIPNADQKIVQGAGHAVIADKTDIFNQILIEFLTAAPE